MKLALLALLLPASLVGQSSRWWSPSSQFALDTTSITRSGSSFSGWIKAKPDLALQRKDRSATYVLLRVTTSCTDRILATSDMRLYNAANEVVDSPPTPAPAAVPPGSRVENWYDVLCFAVRKKGWLPPQSSPGQ